MRYRLRFNLGRGVNYMKWQIKDLKTGEVTHLEPKSVNLKLYNCKLVNHKKTAKQIFEGKNKTPCSWVLFNSFELIELNVRPSDEHTLYYNPKVYPHWFNSTRDNVDNMEFESLITFGCRVYKHK